MVEAIILHIPHSSTKIPGDLRNRFLLSDQELNHELLLMTDRYTDDLFSPGTIRYEKIVFPVSRLVVDPERFVDDQMEPMSKKGMGVIYKLTSNGKTLSGPVSEQEREYLLKRFYQPHHEALNKGVEKLLTKYGRALIIDCHSFASLPLNCDFNQSQDRPDICIGIDDCHTPEDLAQGAVRLFREKGYSIKINDPFSSSLVPDQYYQKNKQVYSMMIEINRSLYMDEKTGEKISGYQKIKSNLKWVLDKICSMEPDREDICLDEKNYQEILKWADIWHPALGGLIERKKKFIIDRTVNQPKYKIRKNDINEENALGLLFNFFDMETHSLTSDELRYWGGLAELWRPIAEGH